MIVHIAAVLLIVNAVLALAVAFTAGGHGHGADGYQVALGTIAFSTGLAVLAHGLAQRRQWSRWLMLGPGFLGPLNVVVGLVLAVFAAYASGLMYQKTGARIFGRRDLPELVLLWIWLQALLLIVGGVVNFSLFGYLLSERGRDEFNAPKSGRVVAVLLSTLVWVGALVPVTLGTVRIDREHIPGFLQTAEMRRAEGEVDAEIRESLPRTTQVATFSADSRHLVISPPTPHIRLVVIDLESGAARRPDLKTPAAFRDRTQLRRLLAPDASSFLIQFAWVRLTSGDEIELPPGLGLHNSELLGFHTPELCLLYDRAGRSLDVLDLPGRRYLHSAPIGNHESLQVRDPIGGRTDTPPGWSPRRDRFSWIEQEGTLKTLMLPSGLVQSTNCPGCRLNATLRYADDGASVISIAPNGYVTSQGEHFDGELYYLSGDGVNARALLFDSGRHRLIYRDMTSSAWFIDLGDGLKPLSASGGRHLLFNEYARGVDSYWLASFAMPPGHTDLVMAEIPLSKPGMMFRDRSPDGRFALFATADAQIEIVDLHAVAEGTSRARTMNLIEEGNLVVTETAVSGARKIFTWAMETAASRQHRHDVPSEWPDDLD